MTERRGGWLKRSLEIQAELNRPLVEAAPRTPAPAASRTPSLIELDCEVEGSLSLDGPVVVHGDFKGSIDCRDVVTVGEAGTVQGPIRGRQVVIHGSVVGDVTASRDVVMHATARLHGDVKTTSFVLERGAFYNGRIEMDQPTPISRSVAEVAAAPTSRPPLPAAKPAGV